MELRQKVLNGFGWMASTKLLGQIFSWAVTLIVVRILTPGDYGLMAMAALVLTFLNLVSEMGLSSAIVQQKTITEEIIRRCFGMILIINLVLFVMLYFSAIHISGFFSEPKLVPVVQVISLSFLITGLSIVPEAILERNMRFKKISIINLSSVVAGAAVTLTLALMGHGVWSLVWGNISQVLVKTIGYNINVEKFLFPSFNLAGMKSIISFSSMVAMERTLMFFYNQADSFLIGKIFGKELLGIYSVAADLASMPMQKLSGVINQVAFPAFSSIQADRSAISQYTLKAARLLCFTSFPVFWGISGVSPEFVNVILGAKWHDAILPLQLLTLVMPFRMLSNIMSPILRGVGHADTALINLTISACIMTLAFYIGTDWGIIGVCYAWLIAFPFVFIITTYRTTHTLFIEYLALLKTITKPLIAAGGMYLAIIYTRNALPEDFHPAMHLSILIMVGAITYGLIIITTASELKKEALSLLK